MPVESAQCPQCGSPLHVEAGQAMAVCAYCGSHLRISVGSAGERVGTLAGIQAGTALIAKERTIEHLRRREADLATRMAALTDEQASLCSALQPPPEETAAGLQQIRQHRDRRALANALLAASGQPPIPSGLVRRSRNLLIAIGVMGLIVLPASSDTEGCVSASLVLLGVLAVRFAFTVSAQHKERRRAEDSVIGQAVRSLEESLARARQAQARLAEVRAELDSISEALRSAREQRIRLEHEVDLLIPDI